MAPKKTLEQKREFSDHHFEYAKVLINYIKEGSQEQAESYIDGLMKADKQTSCKAFHHSLIHACSKMGCPAGAIWCALRMVRAGLKPNIVTFNALLDTAAKSGDVELATRLWGLMGESGLTPNSITYNTMMNAFAKANDAHLAEQWLKKMRTDGISTCAVSFQMVIAAFAKRGDCEKAEAWFRIMEESGVKPDRAIFNSMIWAKSSHPAYMERWLLEMEKSGLLPDDKAYMTMANLWSKNGCLDRAKVWMQKRHHRRGTQASQQADEKSAGTLDFSAKQRGHCAAAKERSLDSFASLRGHYLEQSAPPLDFGARQSGGGAHANKVGCAAFDLRTKQSGPCAEMSKQNAAALDFWAHHGGHGAQGYTPSAEAPDFCMKREGVAAMKLLAEKMPQGMPVDFPVRGGASYNATMEFGHSRFPSSSTSVDCGGTQSGSSSVASSHEYCATPPPGLSHPALKQVSSTCAAPFANTVPMGRTAGPGGAMAPQRHLFTLTGELPQRSLTGDNYSVAANFLQRVPMQDRYSMAGDFVFMTL